MLKSEPYRDRRTIQALVRTISEQARDLPRPLRVMEVCGTHTMAIHLHGLKIILEDAGISLVAGPGCPVCITPNALHEAAIGLVAGRRDVVLATFGDMTRVPTPRGALQNIAPERGSQVRIVYSPLESLELARGNPGKEVVFFGAGFETTIPAIAVTIQRAAKERLKNFSVLSAFWLIPPPLRAILEAGETRISGFLYPGHVAAIIGPQAFGFVAREFKRAGAIAGFEPADILLGLLSVINQLKAHQPAVANVYARVVGPEGNPSARAVMESVMEPADAVWRGLGRIPLSRLRLRPAYAGFDAERKLGLTLNPVEDDLPGCRCGDVLKGLIEPPACRLFGTRCSPDLPLGPCMVSMEGSCLVFYKYGRDIGPWKKGRKS